MSKSSVPGIRRTPGVCGGDPCIRSTRIPVWLLVETRQLGASDEEILEDYPTLSRHDLANAWAYYEMHQAAIDRQIASRESEGDLSSQTSEPGIRCTPGVCGGDPCIRRTRIPVWLLVELRQLGGSDEHILGGYPTLTQHDLDNAWAYYELHRAEIDQQIASQESEDDLSAQNDVKMRHEERDPPLRSILR